MLTTTEVTPKQTVRNVESALIAHLGMRVSHKKISVATSDDPHRPLRGTPTPGAYARSSDAERSPTPTHSGRPTPVYGRAITWRRLYFEDVEVRRSRTKGVACRVTLRKGEETYIGESEGIGERAHSHRARGPGGAGGDPAGRG